MDRVSYLRPNGSKAIIRLLPSVQSSVDRSNIKEELSVMQPKRVAAAELRKQKQKEVWNQEQSIRDQALLEKMMNLCNDLKEEIKSMKQEAKEHQTTFAEKVKKIEAELLKRQAIVENTSLLTEINGQKREEKSIQTSVKMNSNPLTSEQDQQNRVHYKRPGPGSLFYQPEESQQAGIPLRKPPSEKAQRVIAGYTTPEQKERYNESQGSTIFKTPISSFQQKERYDEPQRSIFDKGKKDPNLSLLKCNESILLPKEKGFCSIEEIEENDFQN